MLNDETPWNPDELSNFNKNCKAVEFKLSFESFHSDFHHLK